MSALDDAIATMQAEATAEETVVDGAIVVLQGIPKLIADAVAKAIAAGATPTQLQAITDVGTALTAKATALSQAIATVPTGA